MKVFCQERGCTEEAEFGLVFHSDYPSASYMIYCENHTALNEDDPCWYETIELKTDKVLGRKGKKYELREE